jgi:hypothetical protein
MAREEVVIGVKVEGDGSGKKTLGDLRKEVDGIKDSSQSVGKNLEQGLKAAEKPAVSIKTQLRNMKDEMAGMDQGTQEFMEMAQQASILEDQIKDVDAQVRFLSSDTKNLDTLVQAGMGIAGSFQAAQGAMALFGSENKEVQKAMQKVVAIQGIMNGVQTVSNVLQRESILGYRLGTAGMLKWFKGLKVVTIAQKVFNAVLKANPIVLIISGIAALVGGLILLGKNVKAVGDFFSGLWDSIKIIIGPVLEFFGIWDEGTTQQLKNERALEEQRKEQSKAAAQRNSQRLKELENERKELAKNHKAAEEDLDFQIEINELLGKSSRALTEEKLQNNIDFAKEQQRLINEQIQSWTTYYEDLFVLSGKSREDFKAQMRGQGIDLDLLLKEATDLQEKAAQQVTLSEAKQIKFRRDQNKSAAEKEIKEDKKQTENKLNTAAERNERLRQQWIANEKRKADARKELADLERSQIADEFDRKRAELTEQHELDMERLDETITEENDLKLALQEKFNQDMAKIQEEERQARIAKIKEIADATLDSAQSVVDIVGSINSLANDKEIKRIQDKQAAGEKLTKAEEKRLIKAEKTKRKIALAEIAIDTARAIAGAVASGASVGFPANIPAIIAGVASVLANVATAANIIGEPLPDVSSGGGSTSAGEIQETNTAPTINPVSEGSTLLNEPTKVVVTEQDITNAQTSVSVIEQEATF